MKRGVIFAVIFLVLSLTFVSACDLDVSLINQDPYPAVPGDYVKLVFQVTGVENPNCGVINFELFEEYPISFDPGDSPITKIKGGTYQRDFNSYLSVPYKVRVDENALDGENEIEVRVGSEDISVNNKLKKFSIEVNYVQADFEIHIDKYSFVTKDLTFEILNIAESDVEALTLQIPKQDGIDIRGSNRAVVGDLDSSEFTTADFKANIKDGEFVVNILYTDETGIRREVAKTIVFDSSYFVSDEKSGSTSTILIIISLIVLVLIFWFVFRRRKVKKLKIRRRGASKL